MSLFAALSVGTGGVCGALVRYLLCEHVDARAVDTLLVNLLGSALLGAVLAAEVEPAVVRFLGTGFCGALTTFSSFAVDTVRLVEDDEPGLAAGNAAVTFVGAVLSVAIGAALMALI